MINHLGYGLKSKYLRNRYYIERIIAILISPLFIAVIVVFSFISLIVNQGKVFFVQSRFGFKNKRFNIYKLRTIDFKNGKKIINSFNRFLRKYRIDEFPQIINLIKGDMSFIGPRPILDELHFQSIEIIPEFTKRYRIKPGLTSPSQVFQGHTDKPEESILKFKYDLDYIQNMSLKLDLYILYKTIFVILGGRGK